MSAMASQITQPYIQAQIKENIKAPRHWPLWGHKGPVARKMFPFDDVIMGLGSFIPSSMYRICGVKNDDNLPYPRPVKIGSVL